MTAVAAAFSAKFQPVESIIGKIKAIIEEPSPAYRSKDNNNDVSLPHGGMNCPIDRTVREAGTLEDTGIAQAELKRKNSARDLLLLFNTARQVPVTCLEPGVFAQVTFLDNEGEPVGDPELVTLTTGESKPEFRVFSTSSPIGRALKGAKPNDECSYESPKGTQFVLVGGKLWGSFDKARAETSN